MKLFFFSYEEANKIKRQKKPINMSSLFELSIDQKLLVIFSFPHL